MKPTTIEFDGRTGERVDREMTDAEIAQLAIDQENNRLQMEKIDKELLELKEKEDAKKAAKAQALAALGLSQEVVNLLAE
jgi:hypothetical protein